MDIDEISRNKQSYYRTAKKRIREAGLESVLEVSEDRIGILDRQVKVYIRLVLRRGNLRNWARAKKIPGFEELAYKKCYGEKPDFYKGYFLLPVKNRKSQSK